MVDSTAAVERGVSDIGGRTPAPDDAALLNDLIRSSLKQSAHTVAEPLLLRLLAIKRTKGEDHPEVATVLASLASVRKALGRHESAEQLWRRVLEIRERTLAPNHFALAIALEHLGEACAARGKIGEAVALLQRAHSVRELTLGVDHSSLGVSRDRIADLQLQASEESPDSSAAESTASELSTALPVNELPATNGESLELAPAPYLDALLNIQREMEADYQEEAQKSRAADILASVLGAVRVRQKSLIAAGAMALLVGVAAVSYGWSGRVEPGATEQSASPSATSSLPAASASTASNGPVILANAPAKPVARASAASIPVATRTRDADERTPAKKKGNGEPVAISIPKVPSSLAAGFDGVVKTLSTADLGIGESFAMPATPVAGNAQLKFQSDDEGSAPAQSARLIGALPTPRLPSQLLDVQGEVRVRFNVDTSGQPVMSSLSVVNSPNVLLTAAVLKVIPSLRFEPARSGGADSKPIADVVQLRFQFTK